jgi:Domain of unknown function (DUF6895)
VSGKVPLRPLDEADLEARLCRALDISKRAVQFFAVDGYIDSERPENSFRSEKPVAETAMLLYAASGGSPRPRIAARIDEIARLLAPFARSEQTLLNIALHPALALDFAIPHILLSKLGYRDPGIDDFIRSCRASMARDGRERPPFGSLEKRWIESLYIGGVPGREWRSDLISSVLNRPLDLLGGLREDAYAFTHLLMYCTDFGFRSPYLPRARSIILAAATSLLAKCLDEEDYDLAGEVIMAWPLTRAPWSPSAVFGLHVLARVEDEVGILPGGTTRAARLNKLKGKERTRYAVATAYHTAYVMGMLCAVSLRSRRAPSRKIARRSFDKSFVDHLVSLLERDQGHWQPALLDLSQSERNALGPLLLDIAIVQKCRKRDFQAVKELLVMASRYEVACSLLCAQAAELLERLAACSGCIHRSAK